MRPRPVSHLEALLGPSSDQVQLTITSSLWVLLWTDPLQHVLPESQLGWIRDVSVPTVYPALCWEGRISQEQTDEM